MLSNQPECCACTNVITINVASCIPSINLIVLFTSVIRSELFSIILLCDLLKSVTLSNVLQSDHLLFLFLHMFLKNKSYIIFHNNLSVRHCPTIRDWAIAIDLFLISNSKSRIEYILWYFKINLLTSTFFSYSHYCYVKR